MDKAKIVGGACVILGVAGTLAWFMSRSNHYKALDAILEKESKEKHYDINLVQRIRNEFIRLAGTHGYVDRKSFISWLQLLFHIPPGEQELTARLSVLFDLYDKDNNGKLDAVEFLNGLALLSSGTIAEKASFMFDSWDINHDGFLTYDELHLAYRKAILSTTKLTAGKGISALIGQAFSSKIAQAANSRIFKNLPDSEVDEFIDAHVKELMKLVDDNKDGRISKAEWLRHAAEIPYLRLLDFSEEAAHTPLPVSPYKVEIACSKYKAALGEGPHWDPRTKRLYYVDILQKKILSLDPTNEDLEEYDVGGLVGCVVPCKNRKGSFLVATQDGINLFDTVTKKHTQLVAREILEPNKPANRFNDGKVDSLGRLWVGTMTTHEVKDKQGSFYRVDPDGKFEVMFRDVSISNGLTWSLDEKKFYYIDTPTRTVARFDYDKHTGTLSSKEIFISIPEALGSPDGMTIDADGNLWIAMWGGGRVTKWDGKSGNLLQMVRIPAPNVTSVCFGGPNLDILYVTCASVDTDRSQHPEAGCVFSVTGLGVRGLPLHEF